MIGRNQYADAVFPNGVPAQTFRWLEERRTRAIGVAAGQLIMPPGSIIIEVVVTEDCYIRFGGEFVTATTTIADFASRLLVEGTHVIVVPDDPFALPNTVSPRLSVIRVVDDGIIYVERLV